MKTTTQNKGVPIKNLAIDLTEIIDRKHRDLLRVTNGKLIRLFSKIGKELNQYDDKNKGSKHSKFIISEVSKQLVANYGPYFIERNLKKMAQFADQFPDLSPQTQILSFVSWDHLLLLMKIKDLEAKFFYLNLTIEQGLSVNKLRKQISSNIFEHRKPFNSSKGIGMILTRKIGHTKMNDQKFLSVSQPTWSQVIHNKSAIQNLFKLPFSSALGPLLVISKDHSELIEKNKKSGVEELCEILTHNIEEFSRSLNRWANNFLNLSFHEIGKRINDEILQQNKEIKYRKLIIHNTSIELKRFGKHFSEKQMYEMSIFAEQFPDLRITVRITHLISWEHILVLLTLKEVVAKLFYARLAATQRLSVADLRKQISQNAYEKSNGAKEREQNTITASKNPVSKKRIVKKGNAVSINTTESIDFGEDISSSIVPNILENPYLHLLV